MRYAQPYCEGSEVMCCWCRAPMTFFLWTDVPDGCQWVFWRCTVRSDHVTRALPYPVQMARG